MIKAALLDVEELLRRPDSAGGAPPEGGKGGISKVELKKVKKSIHSFLQNPPKQMKIKDNHQCKVLCQRFGMKFMGPDFASIDHPKLKAIIKAVRINAVGAVVHMPV